MQNRAFLQDMIELFWVYLLTLSWELFKYVNLGILINIEGW
jgi:hypothetical protein